MVDILKEVFSIFDEDISNLYTYNVTCTCGRKTLVILNTGDMTTDCECGATLIPTNLIKIISKGEILND